MREQILQFIPDISIIATVYRPEWLQVNSTILKPDVFVLLKYDDMSPSFGKVQDVLGFDNCTIKSVILSVQVYISDYYDSHCDSFVVRPSGK